MVTKRKVLGTWVGELLWVVQNRSSMTGRAVAFQHIVHEIREQTETQLREKLAKEIAAEGGNWLQMTVALEIVNGTHKEHKDDGPQSSS